MAVAAVSSQSSAQATAAPMSTGAAGSLDYTAFMRLLIAQMQNQDPMNPMESSDYVAQLATFSQVEQSVQVNARLDELLSATRIAQAEGLIGRTITSSDGTVTGDVVSARIVDGGVVAVLTDGSLVPIEPGVVISGGADTGGADE